MSTTLQHPFDLFRERLMVMSEYPFSGFQHIQRCINGEYKEFTFECFGKALIKITAKSNVLITVSIVLQTSDCTGVTTAHFDIPTGNMMVAINEYGTFTKHDGQDTWVTESNMKQPTQVLQRKVANSLGDVGRRLISRFSRVDLM